MLDDPTDQPCTCHECGNRAYYDAAADWIVCGTCRATREPPPRPYVERREIRSVKDINADYQRAVTQSHIGLLVCWALFVVLMIAAG